MRDINRIKPILSKIELLWREYPDLRFVQIVDMIKHDIGTEDLFYTEDDIIEDTVDILLDKNKRDIYVTDNIWDKRLEEMSNLIDELNKKILEAKRQSMQ